MCGIAGRIYYDNEAAQMQNCKKFLADCSEHLGRRGPDSQGYTTVDSDHASVIICHNRLAIQDLSASGHQPAEFDGIVITFNGMIYNFVELRNELIGHGYKFTSNSDTEVLLKAWHLWGEDCLPKLNGMFAFGIVDGRTNELILVRDRFGVKPIFYAYLNKRELIFSSSARMLANQIQADVNIRYCARALKYKVFENGSSESSFDNVYSLEPGNLLTLDLRVKKSHPKTKCWYNLKKQIDLRIYENTGLCEEDLVDECQALLNDAVKIRLRADVPIAVSLSGGLDSTTVAKCVLENSSSITGFTFGGPNNKNSEAKSVGVFSEQNNIPLHSVDYDLNIERNSPLLLETLRAQEAPFGGLSVIAQNLLYKHVDRKGFKVLLGGQGGDEIFAGYRKFQLTSLFNNIGERDLIGSISQLVNIAKIVIAEMGSLSGYASAFRRYMNSTPENSIINLPDERLNLWANDTNNFQDRQILDIEQLSLPTLLRFEDRNSMFSSVESRLPLLDYRLVEFALALPTSLKIRSGFGKWIVRKIMSNKIPNSINYERKKRGFDVTNKLLDTNIGRDLIHIIQENESKLNDFIKKDGIKLTDITVDRLKKNRHLLDEALMLAWICHERNMAR